MQIFVKALSGKTITLEVESSCTVKDIVEILEDKIRKKNYTSETISLIFAGKRITHHTIKTAVVDVVDGNSRSEGGVCQVNLDQPLLLFYHKVFKARRARAHPAFESKLAGDGETAYVGDVRFEFHRTVRVPDNDKTHSLPPSLGNFKLFNVGQSADNLPPSILRKGGVFLSMYQREAMWMSFEPAWKDDPESYAVKISVGGVNALTGLPQNQSVEGKQDYIVVGGANGQKWLDGISTAPNVVRQFVAMPLGTGYTVEGQVTGKEDVGGIQIDVFGLYTDCRFGKDHRDLNSYMTPRQLGLRHGDVVNLYYDVLHDSDKTLKDHNILKESTLHLVLRLRGGGPIVPPVRPVPLGANIISGIAAGGHISQKINRDPIPAWAYDTSKATHLHLTVVNAAYFTQVTGLPSPPSPISPQTYLELKLPWYSLYDEQIPTANNVTGASPLANVKSIGQIMGGDSAAACKADTKPCGYCSYELATLQLSPCGHLFCNDCANTNLCPSCGALVAHRVLYAAPMPVPGREAGDGVEAMSLDGRIIKLRADARGVGDGVDAMSHDEPVIEPRTDAKEEDDGVNAMSLDGRIFMLRAGARVGMVQSFRLKTHAVAEPSGISNTEVNSRGLICN